jgi:tRNA 2-thiouridine synthesizing protein A
MIEVDVRGFSCPIPVIRTKKAIEENPNEVVMVLTETGTARENVTRLAQSKGYSITIEELGDDFHIQLSPPGK